MDMYKLQQAFEPCELGQLAERAITKLAQQRPHLVNDLDRQEGFYELFADEIEQYVKYQDYDDIIVSYMNDNWNDQHSNTACEESKGDEKYMAYKDGAV